MGRRALRKIDAGRDLHDHLKAPGDLPDVWTSTTVFGNRHPLELEVGSGKGLFMSTASTAYPQRNFLGIEVSRKYARFAASRLARSSCANAIMIHGEAVALIHQHVPDGSVGAVHIYFPDPWWKKRHKKRRIMNRQFVQDIQRVLAPDGVLHFWTDVEEYFCTSLDLIARSTGLKGPVEVPERPSQHDLDFRTHFERRTRLHHLRVYRAEFRK